MSTAGSARDGDRDRTPRRFSLGGRVSPGFRRTVIALILCAGVLAGIDLAVYWLVPAQRYAQQFIERLHAATGAELSFRGRPHLSLFPRLALQLNDVEVTGTPGTTLSPLAAVDELHVQFDPGAFLRGELAVERVVLFDPVVSLTIGPTGIANWNLAGPDGASTAPVDPTQPARPARYRFDDIRVINGTLAFVDLGRDIEPHLIG